VTPSSSADAGSRTIPARSLPRRGRTGVPIRALGLTLLVGAATATSPRAAEGDFVWNTELREIYSQNVQRIGGEGADRLLEEMLDLWSWRVVILAPPQA